MEQGLGGDAAAVEADAAEAFVALYQNDFLAEVGRVKRRGVTAWPGADNYDFSFDGFHVNQISGRSSHLPLEILDGRTRSTVKRAAAPPSITRWS